MRCNGTPLAGSNWQEVAETAMDLDTSYNYTSTPGQQDTLNFGALAGTITTLYGIQLTYAARKDDAGARSVKSIVKIAGTSYAGATRLAPRRQLRLLHRPVDFESEHRTELGDQRRQRRGLWLQHGELIWPTASAKRSSRLKSSGCAGFAFRRGGGPATDE